MSATTLAQNIYNHIKESRDKWNNLRIYASPYPEYPDYGVEEQELMIRKGWLDELKMIAGIIECDDLIDDIYETLITCVENYVRKYKDRQSRVKKVIKVLELEDTVKPGEIYCYISKDNERKFIGFMNSYNHDWDDDCFYKLEFHGSFSDAIENVLDEIEDEYELECFNSDDDNLKCYFTGKESELINSVKGIELE